MTGFEPATSASQKQHSTKLSYIPECDHTSIKVALFFHIEKTLGEEDFFLDLFIKYRFKVFLCLIIKKNVFKIIKVVLKKKTLG
jgi:hypothetical protein